MRIKRIMVALAVLGLIGIVAFPYIANFISIPIGRPSLTNAERQMSFISQAIRAYKVSHSGHVPQSYSEFIRCLQDQPGYEEISQQINEGCFQFHTSIGSQDPVLVSCYLPYRHGKTMLWIDREGTVFCSRVWLWPTWRNQIR